MNQPTLPGIAPASAQRAAQAAGANLEGALAAVHARYHFAKLANVERSRPPAVYVAKLRRYLPERGGRSVDYDGTLAPTGQRVLFDAKTCKAPSYEHNPDQFHQLDYLIDDKRFGARTFLLIVCDPLACAYLVEDADVLAQLRRGTAVSLRTINRRRGRARAEFDDFTHHFPVFRRTREGAWDWLPAVAASYCP